MPLHFSRSIDDARLRDCTLSQKLTHLKALSPEAYVAFELLVDESLREYWRAKRDRLVLVSKRGV